MVLNELLALSRSEVGQGVEVTSEITSVRLESLCNSLQNLFSLLVGDSWAKRVVGEVTADTDTGGDNHSGLVSRELRAVKLAGVHVGDVLAILAVLVVHLNNLVEERGEGGIGVVGTSIATNA